MYNKLIIIVPREFSIKEYIKSSLEDFIKKNIKLEIWVVKKLLNPLNHVDKKLMISDKNIQIRIIDNLDTLSEYLSKENVSTLFDLRIKPDIKTKNFFSIFFDFDFDFMIISGLLTREISLKYILFYKFKNFLIKLFF